MNINNKPISTNTTSIPSVKITAPASQPQAEAQAISTTIEDQLNVTANAISAAGAGMTATTTASARALAEARLTAATATTEPETKISKELAYKIKNQPLSQKVRDQIEAGKQVIRSYLAPGTLLCRDSDGGKAGIRQLRDNSALDKSADTECLEKTQKGWNVPTIENPNDPNGEFDPYEYMPDIAFNEDEDSFPILPDPNGDGDIENDLKDYKHGVIGGDQPLKGSFSVAKKGEYTVLTYSFFLPDNKFTNYHVTDSSTVAVYLKPDKNGKLQPDSVYTSWHYGANLAKRDDIKKGKDGRPVILVERGSHALHPYSKIESLPKDGLLIKGDGTTTLDGKALPNQLTWVTPNANVKNATQLDQSNPQDKTTLDAYYKNYPERSNPIYPGVWDED
jgi:hypothetical protein